MAPLKKAEPYRVPTLAEADDTYGALIAKRSELNALSGEARAARKTAERELAADTSPEVRPGVAELLGDGPSAKSAKRKAVAEAKQREADVDAAMATLELRIRDAKTPAVRSVIAKVQPEWQCRMTALTDALKIVDAAHRDLWALRTDLEAEDVTHAHLGPWPFFLGESGESRVANFLKEVGYAA